MSMPPSERMEEDTNEASRTRRLAVRFWLFAALAALALGSQGPGAPSGPALLHRLLPTPSASVVEETAVEASSPSPSLTSVAASIAATPTVERPTVQRTSGEAALELGSLRSRL
jgi:hypothetical protein